MKFFKAAKTSAGLSLLFLVVYGSCNWLTSLRSDVGLLYFQWERHIPFVPWMIVPYMSIDLLFLAGPFLCRTDTELQTLARRIIFVILAGGACFLLFPLRFAFDRPPVAGWLGTLFSTFRNFDQPYNLLPSLHMALRTILAATYARHTRGPWRVLSHTWFSLIGFSTVLTWQHHLLDVMSGFLLAVWSFYLIPAPSAGRASRRGGMRAVLRRAEDCPPYRSSRRHRCWCQVAPGGYYAGAAILVALLTLLPGWWPLLLWWPAAALAITAGAYFGLGPGIYRKTNGRLPLSTRFILGPCLLGQQLSLAYYRRQCARWDEVVPGVLIGRKLNDAEAREAIRQGVTAVLDLTAEFAEARPFLKLRYCTIPILDLTAPTPGQLAQMAEFLHQASSSGTVYVHCKIGYSRSAAAVGAWLLATRTATTIEEVLDRLRAARPSLIIRPEVISALTVFRRRQQEASGILSVPGCILELPPKSGGVRPSSAAAPAVCS